MTQIKFVAEIDHVREVSLRGAADLAAWREPLAAVDLEPASRNGDADVMLSATDAKFRGVRFREFSISILACDASLHFSQLSSREVVSRFPARKASDPIGGVLKYVEDWVAPPDAAGKRLTTSQQKVVRNAG